MALTMFFLIWNPLSLFVAAVGFLKTPVKWRQYYWLLVLTIGVITYCADPSPSYQPDFYRYFRQMDMCSNMSWAQAKDFFSDGLVVKNFIFWVCGHLRLQHLVTAASAMCVYGVSIYITCDFAESCRQQKWIPQIVLFQILMLPYASIVSNIRCICAFSLVILGVYMNLCKKQKHIGIWLLYFVPCLIHPTAIILLIIRFTVRFTKGLTKKFQYIFILLFLFVVPAAVNIAENQFAQFSQRSGLIYTVLRTTVRRAFIYLNDTSEWGKVVHQSRPQQLNRVLLLAAAVLMILLTFHLIKKHKDLNENLMAFFEVLCLLVVASMWFIGTTYWRFSAASIILCGTILVSSLNKKDSYTRLIVMALLALSIPTAMLHAFMERNIFADTWLSKIVETNFYSAFFDIFRSIINV